MRTTTIIGIGIAGAVALAALLQLSGALDPEPLPETAAATAVADPAPAAAPEETAVPVETAETPADPAAALPAATRPEPPRFDLVRADPGGALLVAGSAAPEAQVSVLLDGAPQPGVAADGNGRFAAFLDLPDTTVPRVLRLRMDWQGESIESEEEVILAPAAAPATAATPVPVESDEAAPAQPAGDEPLQTAVLAGAEAPDATGTPAIADAPAAPASEPAAVQPAGAPAPAALLSSAEGVTRLDTTPAPARAQIAIDAISYDENGGVAVSGRGTREAFLRIYLDNAVVTSSRIDDEGRWHATLPEVDSGTYTLRVDQLDAAGKVTSRAESPFLREDPAKLAAVAAANPETPLRAVTIQPGHTLWAIARDRYGDGMSYVRIFEANKGQIRNPDLIYPGQVFDIPD